MRIDGCVLLWPPWYSACATFMEPIQTARIFRSSWATDEQVAELLRN